MGTIPGCEFYFRLRAPASGLSFFCEWKGPRGRPGREQKDRRHTPCRRPQGQHRERTCLDRPAKHLEQLTLYASLPGRAGGLHVVLADFESRKHRSSGGRFLGIVSAAYSRKRISLGKNDTAHAEALIAENAGDRLPAFALGPGRRGGPGP